MLMAEAIPRGKRVTLGGDKNYQKQEIRRRTPRENEHHPHVAQNDTNRRSAVDERTTRHVGYEVRPAESASEWSNRRVDEDGRNAKEVRCGDRKGSGGCSPSPSCLQPMPIAKPNGQNMTRKFRFGARG